MTATATTTTPRIIRNEADAHAWLKATGTEVGYAVTTSETGPCTVTIPMPCQRCGGSGYGGWFQDGGKCYECGGHSTKNRKIVRTFKKHVQLLKAAAKKTAKRSDDRAAARERSLEGQRSWCEANTPFGRVTFDEKSELERKQREEKSAELLHVGTVGKREEFTVTIKATPSWDGSYGLQVCHIMEDDQGNSLVWITNDWLDIPAIGPHTTWSNGSEDQTKGHRVTIKATVKEHGERDGVKQTKLTRVKLVCREWTAA